MKEKFKWAFRLSPVEEQNLFKTAEFFLDTNVLLNIYRVNDEIANKVIAAISALKKRVHITNHVATEYHWDVIEIVADRIATAQKQKSELTQDKVFTKIFTDGYRSSIPKDELLPYKDLVNDLITKSLELITARQKSYEDEFNTMRLANIICDELTGCLEEPLSAEEYATLRADFPQRAVNDIPPGYKDNTPEKKNKRREGISNEAGDYIIWGEILSWVKREKKDVIFVSDDIKEDWIWEIHGFKIGPRWELKKKFFHESGGKTFHILTLDKFLALTDQLSPDELEQVRQAAASSAKTPEPIKLTQPVVEVNTGSDEKFAGPLFAEKVSFKNADNDVKNL